MKLLRRTLIATAALVALGAQAAAIVGQPAPDFTLKDTSGKTVRLSNYSRECIAQLRADTGIQYEGRQAGTLQLFRSQKQVDQAQLDMAVLKECGIDYELLDPAGVARAEPALAQADATIAGGLRLPADETGDCFKFTNQLARMAEALGVTFRFSTSVHALLFDGQGAVNGVQLEGAECEVVQADRYVLAMGSYSRNLLLSTGLDIPVYPVKGYSLTIPIVDEALAPVSTVLDETYKIALTRFDNRIRVGGMAELGGFDLRLNPARRATLEKVVTDLFPGGDVPRATFWTGLHNRRYMTGQLQALVGRAAQGGAQVAVLVLDIDHFKSVNDSFGHDAGDEVLVEFAVRLATNVRAVDLPCRMGGEEFVVVMPGASLEDAGRVAERIRRDVASAPFRVMGGKEQITITISIGVAATTGDGDTPEGLLKRADEGVYEAKAAGRNRVIAKAA